MYLSENFDLLLSANATKASRGLMSTPPVSQLISNETSPGYAAVPLNATDAQWQEFVKSSVSATLHPVGSVALGPKDEGGCVDSNLLVYGTKNVRVIGKFLRFLPSFVTKRLLKCDLDSSVIPIQISAHLSATVYGIAEKVRFRFCIVLRSLFTHSTTGRGHYQSAFLSVRSNWSIMTLRTRRLSGTEVELHPYSSRHAI